MKHKVFAYITRQRHGTLELLVFTHRDFPDAGVQVPAGTVESGELIKLALQHEIEEECSLTNLQVVQKMSQDPLPERDELRHVFQLTALDPVPDEWTHTVKSADSDDGMVFVYSWVDVRHATLAGDQGKYLTALQ